MIGSIAILLSGLTNIAAAEVRFGLSGGIESLSRPVDAEIWRDGSGEAFWIDSAWSLGVGGHFVSRWDITDAELKITAGRKWSRSVETEFCASLGRDHVYLASWSMCATVRLALAAGWSGECRWKQAAYRDFWVYQPELLVERYFGTWKLGMGGGVPWADGLAAGLSGRASIGWDWSDRGGVGLDMGIAPEAESGVDGVISRLSSAVAASFRQGLGDRTMVRVSGAWTWLEAVHDRKEVRLGFEVHLGR